ncbi:MAG: DNA-binding protein [Acidobacteria bacterium]|nr:DNA-binding protein [Acidobacteriota bacterium]
MKSTKKSPSTRAGEYVREEMEHIREGKHGARSTKQAIAIGLSKARRAGVKLAPPAKGKTSAKTREQAEKDYATGERSPGRRPARKRSQATSGALRREGHEAASPAALSRQARASASRRGAANRRRAAQKAVRTKGPAGLRGAARKAAATRRSR